MTDITIPMDQAIDATRDANVKQSGACTILQGYCMSVEKQPEVKIAGASDKLKPLQEAANNRLGIAKANAGLYLNDLHPRMIATVAAIQEYYNLHAAIGKALEPGTSREDAKAMLRTLQETTQEFARKSHDLRAKLDDLRKAFSDDSAVFQRLTGDLQILLNSDKGILKDINEQLSSIDGKIAGVAVGVALSGLAAIAGSLMILIGAFGTVFTGGAATALCVGGGAVLAAGVAGCVGSGVALGNLLNMKSDLLMRRATIDAEVTLINSIAGNFSSLAKGASDSQQAAQTLANSWSFMGEHLGSLYTSLDKGRTDVLVMRKVFLGAAEKSVALILKDAETITTQLNTVPRRDDTTRRIGDLAIEAANSPGGGLRRAA